MASHTTHLTPFQPRNTPSELGKMGSDLTMVTDLYNKTCVLVPGMYQGGPLQRDPSLGVPGTLVYRKDLLRTPKGSMRYAPPGRLDLPETPPQVDRLSSVGGS